ncbi:MAG: hypothetical protein EB027_06670, partial [Actinobacteria bacterium]|nr:hypothetical protein [Actinomycetota bacterium]
TVSVAVSADETDVVVANPQVRIERLLAVMQNSKRAAVDAMALGQDGEAIGQLSRARESLVATLASVESDLDELTRNRAVEEIVDLEEIERRMQRSDRESSMKFAMENWSQKSRGRKRREFIAEDDDDSSRP